MFSGVCVCVFFCGDKMGTVKFQYEMRLYSVITKSPSLTFLFVCAYFCFCPYKSTQVKLRVWKKKTFGDISGVKKS